MAFDYRGKLDKTRLRASEIAGSGLTALENSYPYLNLVFTIAVHLGVVLLVVLSFVPLVLFLYIVGVLVWVFVQAFFSVML